MKPILFLDIDGVLNGTYRGLWRPDDPSLDEWQRDAEEGLDPELVGRLDYIVDETDCVVVLSSSWRKLFPITIVERMLRYRGFEHYLYGATPHLNHPINGCFPRGAEIDAWLRGMGLVVDGVVTVPYVILDDDGDMAPHDRRHIKTDNRHGLTRAEAELAVEWLGKKTK